MKRKFSTGLVLGGLIGISGAMFMSMDKQQIKKVKKTMSDMPHIMKK